MQRGAPASWWVSIQLLLALEACLETNVARDAHPPTRPSPAVSCRVCRLIPASVGSVSARCVRAFSGGLSWATPGGDENLRNEPVTGALWTPVLAEPSRQPRGGVTSSIPAVGAEEGMKYGSV